MAKVDAGDQQEILCPCVRCQNRIRHKLDVVEAHLISKGMDPTYTTWVLHGERVSASRHREDVDRHDTYTMYRDAFFREKDFSQPANEGGVSEFTHLLEYAKTPLNPGCTKYIRLSTIVALYKHKITHGLSDKGFNELLEIVRDMLPHPNTFLDSMYSTKKLLKTFDLGYEKIHACVNDCCLFRKDLESLDMCSRCDAFRWKVNQSTKKIKVGVPAKVLRYFSIIPKLKRMFTSPKK